MNRNDTVAVLRCTEYDVSAILSRLRAHAQAIGLTEEAVAGKRIVIKPNLLLAYAPEKAATTHPVVMEAVILLLRELGARSLLIAESPGGIYSPKTLSHIYGVTGMKGVSERTGVPLNEDVSFRQLSLPDGKTAKTVDMITPIYEADLLINVCKLKTHALAVMTAASKNLFGVIPGIRKFEMHARFKKPEDFFSMVLDLDTELDARMPVFHICDGIIGMEGDGPSGGTPKPCGVLLMSRNPCQLDLVASAVMGVEGRVPLLQQATDRGLCATSSAEVPIVGILPQDVGCGAFVLPDAAKGRRFEKIPAFLEPRPVIDRETCRGCRLCIESCPQKTIVLHRGKAKILSSHCIKCYCCQELCTFKAVKIKKNFIYRMIE